MIDKEFDCYKFVVEVIIKRLELEKETRAIELVHDALASALIVMQERLQELRNDKLRT